MLLSAHLAAALIIGKLTGNYPAALAGSLVIDLDHFVSYWKSGVLFKPKKWIHMALERRRARGDHRFLHSLISWVIISGIVILVNHRVGFIYGLAYVLHLVLDTLTNTDLFPLFPKENINLRKPIVPYNSRQEYIFTGLLVLIFVTLCIEPYL